MGEKDVPRSQSFTYVACSLGHRQGRKSAESRRKGKGVDSNSSWVDLWTLDEAPFLSEPPFFIYTMNIVIPCPALQRFSVGQMRSYDESQPTSSLNVHTYRDINILLYRPYCIIM